MATEFNISWNANTTSIFEANGLIEPLQTLSVGGSTTYTLNFVDKQTNTTERRTYRVERKSNKRLDFNRVDGYRAKLDVFNVFKWRSTESSALSQFVNKRDKIAPDQCTLPGFHRYGLTCFMNAALKQVISECKPGLTDTISSTFAGKTEAYCKLALAFAKLSDECHRVKGGAGTTNISQLHRAFYTKLQEYATLEQRSRRTKAKKSHSNAKKPQTEPVDGNVTQKTVESKNKSVSPPEKDNLEPPSSEVVLESSVKVPKLDGSESSECETTQQTSDAASAPPSSSIKKQSDLNRKCDADELSNIRMLNKLFGRGNAQQDSHELIQFLIELANLKSTNKEITEDSKIITPGTNATTKLPGKPNLYHPLLLDKRRTLGKQLSVTRTSTVEPESLGKPNRKKVDYISSPAPQEIELLRIQVKLFDSYGFGELSSQSRLGFKAKGLIPRGDTIEVDILNSTTNKTETCKFRIQSIVVHEGKSLNSGHYYTLERGDDNTWIKHDDDLVTVSTKSLSSHFSLFSDAAPYLIVLEKVN
ncbi:hypothetical protein SOPP22_01290 [Shewanella sp. OPT22]|nr:hypothetical protein SOPP22_01290 [Shewanella sp. OPT22]